ncbi:proline-rich protein 36-like [Amphibalanus amphitrite]|uniref:proline-rich protein 36-like n=1 Tax=Amphibalanus amphitrite TaxID=1232801 RepID=UPI001C909C5A|nr:proline-rich protein 36-like [Amphibalanus amphitrite]
MPFYLRHISPLQLCDGRPLPGQGDGGDESCAAANAALTTALHQLSSLVLAAEDIFEELHDSFVTVSDRAQVLRNRVEVVRRKVVQLKNTDTPIPESDLCTFSQRTHHFSSVQEAPDRDMFTAASRPSAIRRLYRRAVLSPVTVLRQLDTFRNDGLRSSKFFSCTPTYRPAAERAVPLDIETRRPEAFELLPDWSGDEEELISPVHPDNRLGTLPRPLSEAAGRRLPSPDRLTRARTRRFPAQVIPLDVTGHSFERQLQFRRSLVQYEYVKKRRRKRSKQRRNTIGSSSDLSSALEDVGSASSTAVTAAAGRQVPTDDRQTQTEPRPGPGTAPEQRVPRAAMADVQLSRVDGGDHLGRQRKLASPEPYVATAGWPGPAVRRRPAAAAAVSEGSSSGRGSSGGSDLTSAETEPRVVSPADSGTAISPADEGLGSPRRRPASPADSGLSDGGRADESGSSEHTVTPEYGDGDTSSVFSCDAEGYYTSFHIDSGLRGAPQLPARPDSRSSTLSAGSSGTAPRCRPPPPPRASSLDSWRREGAPPTGSARTRSPGGASQRSGGSETDGEQFRSRTALTTGRIPSLCVVTPPASEDGERGSPGRRAGSTTIDSDRERTPRPEDGSNSGWVGDGRPPKAPWGAPLSDWTGSDTGDSSGSARTPPLVRPEAEGEEHSGGPARAREAAPSPDSTSLSRLNGSESWCSSSHSLLSTADLPRQMAALAVSPSRPTARYAGCPEMPVYDAPVPVRPAVPQYQYRYPYQGRPGSYSAPASPMTGPRALPRQFPAPVGTDDRQPTDAGVRCAAEPAAARRASVAGATPSSPPWAPAEELSRRVSDSAASSPVMSRSGSLDRRAVRRYTAAAAARIYSSLRLLRGKKDSASTASVTDGESVQELDAVQNETDRRVPAPGSAPVQYQRGPASSLPPSGDRPQPQPQPAPVYQRPTGTPQPAPPQQHVFRHPSPMPQQRRPPEQRYTLRQYAQLVATYRQQQELYERYQQAQQQQQQQAQQQDPARRLSAPLTAPRGPQQWQAEGHYQSPPLWPRQTWVPSPSPSDPQQEAERRVSLSRHQQPSQDRLLPQTPVGPPQGRPLPDVPPAASAGPQPPPATASQQSPRPQSRSPFGFGRYSLRVRGSEPVVQEQRRPAEAEQVPTSPERRQQTDSTPAEESHKTKRHKKRWFFTLPGKSKNKDKRKSKTDESSDDDGGFAPTNGGGSSFVRYEAPDSVSSGVSSRASTPLTDASVSSSYFEMEQYFPSLNTSHGSGPPARPLSSLSEDSRSLRCQLSPQMRAPRPPNFSDLEYSPPEAAAAAAAAEWRRQGPGAPVAQSPRLPGRQGPLPPPPPPAPLSPRSVVGQQQRQWAANHVSRPTPGGSQIYGSPTVFARPRGPPTVGAGRGWSPVAAPRLSEPGQRASWAASGGGGSPRAAPAGQRSSWSGGPPAPRSPATRNQLTRPTPLNDFKELIARQGRSPAGGAPGRGSATERLRAAAAAGTPASPAASPASQSPLDARNSARAVLFQNRFGGRRGRPPGTSVIATTIPETEDELSEEPPPPQPAGPPSRRQLFPAAGDARSSSSGSSPDRTAGAPLRMSPSSPPPPYSAPSDARILPTGLAAERHFTPVTGPAAGGTGGFRRSYSLPRHGDQRPPIGSISRYQFQGRPAGALPSPAPAASPFQRTRSLMARLPSGSERPKAAAGVSNPTPAQSPPSSRVETTI